MYIILGCVRFLSYMLYMYMYMYVLLTHQRNDWDGPGGVVEHGHDIDEESCTAH